METTIKTYIAKSVKGKEYSFESNSNVKAAIDATKWAVCNDDDIATIQRKELMHFVEIFNAQNFKTL